MTQGSHHPHPGIWNRSDAFIDGSWIPVSETVPVEDPSRKAAFGRSAQCSAQDVDRAVVAAATAFVRWSMTPREQRASMLARLHTVLDARRELLVEATTLEVGAPVKVAREAHVDLSLQILADTVALLREPEEPEQIGNSLVFREPAGVVGCITPWNYPLYQMIIKVSAALAAGCTTVVKPAELTPFTAYLLADAVADAGLPAGVFNLVPGRGSEVGEALVAHQGIDVVSFTGSTAVGARIAVRAAADVKRVSLELGGKSASIVLDNADLAEAVRSTVDSAMLNTGQTCSAWTRLLVPAARLDDAVTIAEEHASRLVVGDPWDEASDLGPLASADQLETVRDLLDRARRNGARVTTGGPTPEGGHYHPTVIVSGVEADSEIAREEVFGPVLVVLPHDGDQDAVRMANDSDYGLAGAVWAGTTERGVEVARRLRTGQVDVNGAEFNSLAPFGGFKKSGKGRELGRHGIEEFTELKSVQLPEGKSTLKSRHGEASSLPLDV